MSLYQHITVKGSDMEYELMLRVRRRLAKKAMIRIGLYQHFEGYDPLFILDCSNVILDNKDRDYVENYIAANMPKKFRKVGK